MDDESGESMEPMEEVPLIELGDNSTCKRVLDLLEPGDLKLGQVVIKRVAVVELDLETDEIWSEKVRCSSNMKLRFRAE